MNSHATLVEVSFWSGLVLICKYNLINLFLRKPHTEPEIPFYSLKWTEIKLMIYILLFAHNNQINFSYLSLHEPFSNLAKPPFWIHIDNSGNLLMWFYLAPNPIRKLTSDYFGNLAKKPYPNIFDSAFISLTFLEW